MVNNKDFSKRLQKVIDYYDLSASSFAENIGVQRSSISHILSGRNKPSLDFVMKISATYPEVELYWLLNGTGHFPLEDITNATNTNSDSVDLFSSVNSHKEINQEKKETPVVSETIKTNIENITPQEKQIERIVIFYTDGSFSNFENSK